MQKEFVETNINETRLIIETGEIAKQANGAVLVTMGETQVLVTACASEKSTNGQDFFPLSVEYVPRTYAAGRIPGGFFKREGRPATDDILTARLIDRPIRPLFPDDYMNETQIWAMAVSFDGSNDPDVLGILGASSALSISDIPFDGPFGAIRVGLIGGEFIANPTISQREESLIDVIVAGTENDIIMVEGSAFEVQDDILLSAMEFARPYLAKLCEIQRELVGKIGKPKFEYEPAYPITKELKDAVIGLTNDKIEPLLKIAEKKARNKALTELADSIKKELAEKFPETETLIEKIFHEIEREKMRKMILDEGIRIDGRRCDQIRPITVTPGFLKRTHGSALFTRGETQALCVLTLGTKMDEQKIEDLEGESFKSFMLHYNFPPFSVGEVKRTGSPSRREIGHGALAERALQPIVPSEEMFPYTIRIVSDILESNGSSSMATVCAGSLSMMDAGVPVKTAVAGIAMGLVMEGNKYSILSDIIGVEDHLGDIDFKVAGTAEGITAFQMDVKLKGIPLSIMKEAISQAREGLTYILGVMNNAISKPRETISPFAPRIVTIRINPDKIGALIGTGGKTIRGIQDATNTTIAVEDDGSVQVASVNAEGLESALKMIKGLTEEAEVGQVYEGKVVRIADFGAFVQILPNQDGLLHVSEIDHRRTDKVGDVLKIGDIVKVKVIEVSEDGKIRLSRKALIPRPEGNEGNSDDRRGGNDWRAGEGNRRDRRR